MADANEKPDEELEKANEEAPKNAFTNVAKLARFTKDDVHTHDAPTNAVPDNPK